MKPLKVGIIGLGRIGQLHAQNIKQLSEFELVGCYDPFVTEFEEFRVYQDIEQFLANDDIQAVLICSPSNLHCQHVLLAAKYQKHIFCEKPIGLNEPDIIEAIGVCKHAGLKLQVGFNRRFDKHFSALKQRMEHIEDYKPQIIKITSRDPYPPSQEYLQQSGGIFFDMMIHDFDLLRFISGEEIKEVYAQGWDLGQELYQSTNDYGVAVVQLKLTNGALAIIENARQSNYGYDQRIEVFSDKACFNVSNELVDLVSMKTPDGDKYSVPKPFFLERYDYAFKNQLKSFYDAVIEDKKTLVSGDDGLKAYHLACMATESAHNQKVVYNQSLQGNDYEV